MEAIAESGSTQQQLAAYAQDLRAVYAEERAKAVQLEQALVDLQASYLATARGFAAAAEAKDFYTAGHLRRVTGLGLLLLETLDPSKLADQKFRYGFLLHDIGKLGVPDAILGKAGPLTDDEWVIMRRHPETGATILRDIPFLAGAAEIVAAHHESWDGSGYPHGLAGLDIPYGARLFSVVDAFDAMTTDRVYRPALSFEEAARRLREGAGTQWWPAAIDAFLSHTRARIYQAAESESK